MQIGILTQPLSNNYGGILQNWALQQSLKQMGHAPTTINIPYPHILEKCDLPRLCWRFLKRLKGDKSIIFLNPARQHNFLNTPCENMREFVSDNINVMQLSGKVDSSFCDEHPEIKAYIVGSDQVWRKSFSPFLPNYFLDFTETFDVKRIAYGVSFGRKEMDINQEESRVYSELASRFDAISVREEDGKEICKKQLSSNASLVIDPTLLIDSSDYFDLIAKVESQAKSNRFAAVYVLDRNKQKENDIKTFCDKNDLTPKYIGYPSSTGFPSIESWLSDIANSQYVITDSYHGTIFSIIFKKPFTSICNPSRGASRFITLLTALGLESRLINEGDRFVPLSEMINYIEVGERISVRRSESIAFLKESLGDV